MSEEETSDFMAAALKAQEIPNLLNEYEKTQDSSLLPKIRSTKSDCQQAVDIMLKMLYSIDPNDQMRPAFLLLLAQSYSNLGGIHMYLLEYPDAKNCYKSALELFEELLSSEGNKLVQSSEAVVMILNNLGRIALLENNPDEAVKSFRLAIERLDDNMERQFGKTIRKNLRVAESELK